MSRYHVPRNHSDFRGPTKHPVIEHGGPDQKKLPAYWTSSLWQGHEVVCGRYENEQAAREGAAACAVKSGLRHFILRVEVIE